MAIVRKDEILDKAVGTDANVIPRYKFLQPDGSTYDGTGSAEHLELVLENPILQEGMPYNAAFANENLAASGTTTGTATALLLEQEEYTLFDGAVVRFRNHVVLGPAAFTLNVNGTGAKPVTKTDGTDISSVAVGSWITAIYSATGDAYYLEVTGSSGDMLKRDFATVNAAEGYVDKTIAEFAAKRIPAGSDLNDFFDDPYYGRWYCYGRSEVAEMQNAPPFSNNAPFALDILRSHSNQGTVQVAYNFEQTLPAIYHRNYYPGTGWQAWLAEVNTKGDTMTGPLLLQNGTLGKAALDISPQAGASYVEGIRMKISTGGNSCIIMGLPRNAADSGIVDGAWTLLRAPTGNYIIAHNSSGPNDGLTLYKDGSWPTWKGNTMYGAGNPPARLASEEILANSDFNNYQVPGLYRVSGTAVAQSIANMPIKDSGSLFVETHARSGIKQTFTVYNPANPRTWIRNGYDSTWGAWYEVRTSFSISEGGASNPAVVGITLNTGNFSWYRDGDIVCFEIALSWTANTTSILSATFSSSLPDKPLPYFPANLLWDIGGAAAAGTVVTPYITRTSTQTQLRFKGATGTFLTGRDFAAASSVYVSGSYQAEPL